MKVVLVLFERISNDQERGFGFMGCRLARALHAAGLLRAVVCLEKEESVDLPPHITHVLAEHRTYRLGLILIGWIGRMIPAFDARLARERVFDRFVCRRADMTEGDVLFLSRPLFLGALRKGRRAGMRVWVQASIPHPLANYALVRNEEIRLGLPCRGAYSDAKRAVRLATTIAGADRLVTMDPEIGKYPHESYLEFVGPNKVLPLKHFFGVNPDGFSELAAGRTTRSESGKGVTFVHVSHMNLIKGIPYLLDAWQRFKRMPESEGCRLVLVGKRDENLDTLIRRQYSDLPDVELSGFVSDLLPHMAEADVFVSPSVSDNGPGTIAEAMAAGMPVIASENCGFASLITNGEDGFTYRFNDVDRLVEILRWFSDNRAAIFEMGRNARGNIEHLSVDRYAEEMVEVIEAAAHDD